MRVLLTYGLLVLSFVNLRCFPDRPRTRIVRPTDGSAIAGGTAVEVSVGGFMMHDSVLMLWDGMRVETRESDDQTFFWATGDTGAHSLVATGYNRWFADADTAVCRLARKCTLLLEASVPQDSPAAYHYDWIQTLRLEAGHTYDVAYWRSDGSPDDGWALEIGHWGWGHSGWDSVIAPSRTLAPGDWVSVEITATDNYDFAWRRWPEHRGTALFRFYDILP
jgi:hypothetical protein